MSVSQAKLTSYMVVHKNKSAASRYRVSFCLMHNTSGHNKRHDVYHVGKVKVGDHEAADATLTS